VTVRAWKDAGFAEARVGVQRELQYRLASFLTLVGFLIEPVVLLVVWRTVAEASGGIGGYDLNAITAYYIVWTLVRAMNLALSPDVWGWWIQNGRLSQLLLEPANVFWRTAWSFVGQKFLNIAQWLPIGAVLYWIFRPEVALTWQQVVGFAVAVWLGYAVRAATLFAFGLVGFWTTRANALFQLLVALEILLSGRLVPMGVMPLWVQAVSNWTPFKWAFQFPIDVLIGQVTTQEMVKGFGFQLLWVAGLATVIKVVWSWATRRYSAVGS
jgi:ABC-2 type transport system permease protein